MDRPEMEGPQLSKPLGLEISRNEARRIIGRVQRLKLGLWLVLWLELALTLVLFLLAGVLLGMVFILNFAPTSGSLALFTTIELILIAFFYGKYFFARRRKRLNSLAVSAWVEQAIPGLNDRLITAVEFAEGVQLGSGEAVAALYETDYLTAFFEETEQLIRRTFLSRVYFRRRFALLLLAVLAVLAVFENVHHFTTYTASDLRKIYLNSHQAIFHNLGAPLVVEPGDAKIVRGGELKVSAYSLRAGKKPRLEIFFRAEEQPWESAPMTRDEGGGNTFLFQQLAQPLEYLVSDGKSKSNVYRIQLVDGPQLATIRVKLIMPAYTGLGIVVGEDGQGNIKAVAGTHAEVVVSFREEVTKVEMLQGGEAEGETAGEAGRLSLVQSSGNWSTQFVIDRSGWYRMIATDPEGFSSGKELTYTIEVTEERPPQVQFLGPEPAIDFLRSEQYRDVRPGAIPKLPVEYAAKDDFGLARIELHFEQTDGVSGHRILEEFDYGQDQAKRSYQWDVEPFWGGQPVTYFLRAYDYFALRELQSKGATEHYGDSDKQHLYWGRAMAPSSATASQVLSETGTDDAISEEQDAQAKLEKETAEDLMALAERVEEIVLKQSEINEEAEKQPSDRSTQARLSESQDQVSEAIQQVRRDLQSRADEWKKKQSDRKEDRDRTQEEPPEKAREEIQESSPSGSPSASEGIGEEGSGSQPQGASGQEPQGSEVGQQMQELARSLERQSIERTESGFESKSGLEGESRENGKLLQQGRIREARDKGQEIEKTLLIVKSELKKLGERMGGGLGVNPNQNPGKGPSGNLPELTLDTASGGRKEREGSGHLAPGFGGHESDAFDEYRPSKFDPPELRDLKRKAGALGEFLDARSDENIDSRAPAEERYPPKYEGMVETYFRILTDTGEDL